MKKNKWKNLVSLLSICLIPFLCAGLAGCSSHSKSKQSRIFRMNINREPPTMDPRKGSELIGSAMHYLLYEGLVRLNPDGTVTPAQAKSVEISDDRLTYTFHLRGTHWSDGSRVTAQDFEHAWKKILLPQFGAANAHLLYPIKNAEKAKRGVVPIDQVGIYSTNDKTFVVELEKPTPYFLELISFCVFFPVNHKIDEANPNWVYEASSQFVSNGPFQLKTWKHNREIVFEKNQRYWEAPYINLDQVVVSMIADENTALSMYENGELDIIGTGISPIPTDALLSYYKQGLLKTNPSPGTTIVCFNVHKFPFNNIHIRKALSYAINRAEIVQNVTQLGESVATNIIPPILRPQGSVALLEDHRALKAQEHFQQGLQELGISIKEFPSVTLDYSFSEVNHKLVQVLKEQWMKVLGIQVNLHSCEHKVLMDLLGNHTYDLAQTFWVAQYNDPMNILERFKFKTNAKNYPGWENPDYIRLLDQSAYDETPEKRAKTIAQAEALIMEEMPLTPIYHWTTSFLIHDRLAYKEFLPNGAFDYARISVKGS